MFIFWIQLKKNEFSIFVLRKAYLFIVELFHKHQKFLIKNGMVVISFKELKTLSTDKLQTNSQSRGFAMKIYYSTNKPGKLFYYLFNLKTDQFTYIFKSNGSIGFFYKKCSHKFIKNITKICFKCSLFFKLF